VQQQAKAMPYRFIHNLFADLTHLFNLRWAWCRPEAKRFPDALSGRAVGQQGTRGGMSFKQHERKLISLRKAEIFEIREPIPGDFLPIGQSGKLLIMPGSAFPRGPGALS
jgi:hypothetical protein